MRFFLIIFVFLSSLFIPQAGLAVRCECFNNQGLKFFYDCEPDCNSGLCDQSDLSCSISQIPDLDIPADTGQEGQGSKPITSQPTIQVDILGLKANLGSVTCNPGEDCEIGWIGQYISALFTYGISLAVILSVVMIMIGGLVWLMSGGRQDQIGRAKEFITGALSGLLLALFSVIILQAINPATVKLDPFRLRTPNQVEPPMVGENEGVGAPAGQPGDDVQYQPIGSDVDLVDLQGNNHLVGARTELNTMLQELVPTLAANGQLPTGIQITSGFRPGDTGSQHALGTAVDVWWPGIDLASATSFRDNVLSHNPDLYILTEVRGHPDFQYFRGRGNGVVHIDMRRILGTN